MNQILDKNQQRERSILCLSPQETKKDSHYFYAWESIVSEIHNLYHSYNYGSETWDLYHFQTTDTTTLET